jgi:predicted TIM-barrel fold metal-dependent hydrolase
MAMHATADSKLDAPLIDTHAHIYLTSMPMTGTAWHRPPSDASAEDYIATLDQAGVHFGVIAAASLYGDYNDYVVDSLRRYRRLRATVIVQPGISSKALRDMADAGVVGIRLQFRNVASPPDLASFEYRRLLRQVADLGWHVHLHDNGERLPNYIDTLLAAGPRLVIDHLGRPAAPDGLASDGFKAVLRAVDGGRTWVKVSAGFRIEPPAYAAEVAAALLRHAGPERLMWGSDWPFAAFEDRVTYSDVVSAFRELVPNANARRAMDRTALAFYFS